ncbi:MAG: ATP-binding cassette domain-containing protein [Pseudomonadota bacterium]
MNETNPIRPLQSPRNKSVDLKSGLASYVGVALIFSVFINLLLLVSPIYMLQVYDRILTSGSVDTLIWITVIALFLLSMYAVVEAGRRRVFALAGEYVEQALNSGVFDAYLRGNRSKESIASDVSALQRIQHMLQGSGLSPFFDAPFIPFYLGILYWVHPTLGLVAIGGAILLFAVALIGRTVSQDAYEQALNEDRNVGDLVQGISRQRATIVAMGMGERLRDAYRATKDTALEKGLEASRLNGVTAGLSRSIRQILQVAILGLGGYLAVQQQVSAGAIVAGSILMGRALAPIDQIVQGWRNIVSAANAWALVKHRLQETADVHHVMDFERPESQLEIRNLTVSIPGTDTVLVHPFSAVFEEASIVSIFGRNGCGKTTLLNLLSGAVESDPKSEILFGGSPIREWAYSDRGRHVGYLPQTIDLLPGTVAENIARFDPHLSEEAIIHAARLCGADDMIRGLPRGYNTIVEAGMRGLSAGQAQQIGIARAFYGSPAFLFLDEPTSNLDTSAISSFIDALQRLKAAGSSVFLSTHDIRLLRISDQLLILRNQMASVTDADTLLAQNVPSLRPTPKQSSPRSAVTNP